MQRQKDADQGKHCFILSKVLQTLVFLYINGKTTSKNVKDTETYVFHKSSRDSAEDNHTQSSSVGSCMQPHFDTADFHIH